MILCITIHAFEIRQLEKIKQQESFFLHIEISIVKESETYIHSLLTINHIRPIYKYIVSYRILIKNDLNHIENRW